MANDLWYQLPTDMNAWQSIIVSNIARKVPEIPPYIAGLEFTKIDPVAGDADGLIYLLNGMAGIPVLIRGYRLAPLDVMVDKQENFYPVSGEFLNKLYTDNTLGIPSDDFQRNQGIQEDGPARRVEAIKTVDAVKRASATAREKLAAAIEDSPLTLKFLDEQMGDVLTALYAPVEETVKEAATEEQKPEFEMLFYSNGHYFLNDTEIDAKTAGEKLNEFGVEENDRIDFMSGAPVVVDRREKIAGIYMGDSTSAQAVSNSPYCLTCVVGNDGIPRHGIVLHREVYVDSPNRREDSNRSYTSYLYVGPDCHALQSDMLLLDPMPIDASKLHELSVATEPLIGRFGIAVSGCSFKGPFEVIGSTKHGNEWKIRTSNLLEQEFTIDQTDNGWTFYEVPREQIGVVKSEQEAMVSMPGATYRVASSVNGKLVLDNQEMEYLNGAYELVRQHGIDVSDALKVASSALMNGSCMFKVAKESAGKGGAEDAAQAAQEQAMFNATQPPPIQPNVPVQFEDIEDIAKINNPSLMSAYLTGKLVDVNMAGREQMMQISDDILEATKSLGKLLFLIRMGSVTTVNEADAQMALNKMTDVAKSVGTAPILPTYSE